MNHCSMNYIYHFEDEIALEGLDGITIEGLWLRLQFRHNFPNTLTLDDSSKNFLWSLIVQDEEISFCCLEEPRSPLRIFNRYEYIDSEMGLILEPKEDFEDVYPCCPVDDEAAGVRGSCSTYKTRKDITDEVTLLSLQEALEKYGSRLVIVASQTLRNKALCVTAATDKFYDLTILQYVILERIGRSRTMGEITYGKNSLAVMNLGPKTMFYFRKRLLKLNLITKQSHRQRSVKGIITSSSLLHLSRFYVVRKPKYMLIIQKVVEILKSKPNYTCPSADIKKEIGIPDVSIKKIFKNSEFLKYIQMVFVRYRQIHKDATEKEWRYKIKNEEKSIRCLQLINPNVNSEDVFQDEEEEEADDADEYDTSSGILDQSKLIYGRSILQQAYMVVEAAGPDGMSQIDMSKQLGQKKLDSRSICRSLQKRNVIHSLMKDIGRQRVSRYVSNRFASTGHLLQEFETERKKMMEIVESSKKGHREGAWIEDNDEVIQYQASTPSTSRIMESDSVEEVEIGLEMTHSGSKTAATVHEEKGSHPTDASKERSIKDLDTMIITPGASVTEDATAMLVVGPNDIDSDKWTYIHHKKVSPHLTTRMMKRANIIMKAVRKYKVIDDAFKLQKLIIDSEVLEGSKAKMDRKSLTRLLDRLSRSGFLKKIVVKIKTESKVKDITFVVDSSITLKSNLLKQAIEQQKHKFLVQASARKDSSGTVANDESQGSGKDSSPVKPATPSKVKANEETSVGESMLELEKMHNLPHKKAQKSDDQKDSAPDPVVVGVKGGVGPKFVRMQEFHKLLFYLVYGYEGTTDLDQTEAWKTIVDSSPHDLSNENFSEYPTVFLTEISWRMFIPPLPVHMNFAVPGWVFVVDILLRLPLCIFIQIVNVVSHSPQLISYLNHPIKQNFLVKNLPPELRRLLLNGRRYVNYVMELCRRLCYIGLLQQGRQLMKEKDQIFVFLNRRATLIDTTISSPGYHRISSDKEYVRKEYTFYSMQDIIQYWYDMWTICMHTPLGGQMCVQGKKITIQMLTKKPEIIASLKSRGVEEAPLMDTGKIPGDETGAAGLDSAMFAHLKRNWSCLNARFTPVTQHITPAAEGNDEKSPTSERMFSYAQYLRNSCRPNSVESSSSKNRLAGLRNVRLSLYKPKQENEDCKPITLSFGLVNTGKKRKRENETQKREDQKIIRKIKRKDKASYQREIKTRLKGPKKPYYDEEDKAALRRMNKLRVDWYPAEDSLLLLCKVSSAYLFPNKRTHIINFSVVRDLLHNCYPESRNKTSRACQRRINYIMKNPATEENVAIILEELKQDEEITKDFKPAKLSHKLPVLHTMYVNVFKDLVRKLMTKYASNKSKEVPDLPDSFQEFKDKFKIIRASKSLKQGSKLQEIATLRDIDHYVVNALIFSSLCTKQDRESWAYQLYLAYQKYPQKVLNSVLSSIRENKMISYKKCYNRSKYTRTCLPLSTSPFQLSLLFIYTFHMKYQYDIFGHCWNFTKELLDSKIRAIFKNPEGNSTSSCISVPQSNLLSENAEEKQIKDACDSPKMLNPPNEKSAKPKRRKIRFRFKSKRMSREAREARMRARKMAKLAVEQKKILQNPKNASPSLEDSSVMDIAHDEDTFEPDINECSSSLGKTTPDLSEGAELLPPSQNKNETNGGAIEEEEEEEEEKEKEKGVSLPINVEGGCCAAVIALMVTKRLVFDIIIPDQMILIDNQSQDYLKRDKLLEKVKHHETITGKEFISDEMCQSQPSPSVDEDIYMENGVVDNTNETFETGADRETEHDNFSRSSLDNEDVSNDNIHSSIQKPKNDKEHSQTSTTFSGATKREISSENDDSNQRKKIKTSHLDEREEGTTPTVETEDETPSKEAEDTKPKSRLQHSQSRIRMYMMREQMADSMIPPASSWAFDHIFINTCEISCRLRHSPDMDSENLSPSKPEEVSSAFLPIKQETITEALAARKRVVVSEWTKLDPAVEGWKEEGRSLEFVNLATEIFEFIETKKEFGASAYDIKKKFEHFIPPAPRPMEVLREMEDVRLILRVGVDTFRWVTIQYAKTWLIRTNKMSRAKMLSTEPMRLSGVYEVKSTSDAENNDAGDPKDQKTEETSQPTSFVPRETIENESEKNNGETDSQPSSTAESKSVKSNVQNIRSRMALLKTRYRKDTKTFEDMEKAVDQHLLMSQYEEIDVLVRPWVRLNGCLNRRVMDRLLGAVLFYIMECPGTLGFKIADRFWPALQPAHVYELLETLVMIGAVRRFYIRKSHKVTLFSKPQDLHIEPAEEYDYDDSMVYEAEVDAVLRLSMFIGDKKYSQDFLSTCR